ncbi:hypothetical protein Bca4012_018717 [Brassica carinata]|uniref:Uncharacterized protein n=1 Tax=Brassica carinata TaxID=52824 RepID=A0A8X7WL33_BRACI|nr:hypothetical protein Bca52824_002909 [Brassica carinata]
MQLDIHLRHQQHLHKTPISNLKIHQSPYHQESFLVEAATPNRKICEVSPDEYGVCRDEEGNAHAMDERIINVSKGDIEAILEMADSLGGRYLSLPHYEGCFQMHGVHPTPLYLPETDT